MGYLFNYVDWLIYIYVIHPEVQLSQYVQHQIKSRQLRSAFFTLKKRQNEMEKLTTKSALFQMVWVALAIFAVTSVGSPFGRALVMGLGLKMLVSQWQGYMRNKLELKRNLFWQVKREVSDEELKWYLYIMTGLFLWLVWWWL